MCYTVVMRLLDLFFQSEIGDTKEKSSRKAEDSKWNYREGYDQEDDEYDEDDNYVGDDDW